MTLSRRSEPWVLSALLMDQTRQTASDLDQSIVTSCLAFDTSREAQDTPQPAMEVLERLFAKPDGHDGPWHVYALLDAARSTFLVDRLQSSGLDHRCLYDLSQDESLGDVAPWLVALDLDNAFTKATLAHDFDGTDPRRMLDHGIWLASPLPLDEMRRLLRKLTRLKDEVDVVQYFRLQEPAMLHALMVAAPNAACRAVLSGGALMMYPRVSLYPQVWDFIAVQRSDVRDPSSPPLPAVPVVDRPARLVLKVFTYDKLAAQLAVAHIDEIQRPDAAQVFLRLMLAGFDYPERLRDVFDLLQKIPSDAHPSFWAHVESGDYSLGYVIVHFSKHYNLEVIQR